MAIKPHAKGEGVTMVGGSAKGLDVDKGRARIGHFRFSASHGYRLNDGSDLERFT